VNNVAAKPSKETSGQTPVQRKKREELQREEKQP